MGDLEDRFRALDRVRPPDLWPDIENRHPGPRWQRLSPRRLLAGSVAFAVAATGIGFAAWVFSPSSLPGIVGFHPAPKGNGKIAFVAGERLFEFTGGSPSIYVMNSDGSGVQSIRKVYLASSLSWSPDGTKLAFANTNGEFDPESISVMNGDGSEIRQITPDSRSVQAVEPAWSPDGKQIAFAESAWFVNPSPSVTRTLGIYIMRPDGTGIRQLTSCGREVCKGDSSPTWSPDGSHIAFVHRGAIYVMAADGSDLRPIASCPKLGCLAAVLPEWSPDGKKILFMWEKDRRTQLETVTPDGSEITTIFDCGSTCADLSGVTWSPDGRKIAMTFSRRLSTRSDFYVMNADGTGLKRVTQFPLQVCCPAWQPVPLPSPLQSGLPPTGSPPMPPASPPTLVSGEIAFVRRSASTEDQGIFLIINDGPPGKLIDGYEPAFSPDGSMVVFRQSHGEGETEIDVVNTDGTGFRTLTKIAGNPLELAPAWSPDGKRLAYASIGGLYVMNADGSS